MKKTRRNRPGTVALREIKNEQKSVKPAVNKAVMNRLVREIANDYKSDLRIQEPAVPAMQDSAESYLVDMLCGSGMCSVHAGRQTIMPKDIKLVQQIKGGPW